MTETTEGKGGKSSAPTIFEYTIAGKKYTQQELVLGQIEQLINLIQGIVFPKGAGPIEIMNAMGDRLSKAIAIALKAEGQKLKDKDIEELAPELKFGINMDETLQIVEDFFLCNQIASLLEKLAGLATGITENLNQAHQTGSNQQSSSSQKETLQSETKSDGDTPSESANPTSSTAAEK